MGDLESRPNTLRTGLKNREMVSPTIVAFFQEEAFIFREITFIFSNIIIYQFGIGLPNY